MTLVSSISKSPVHADDIEDFYRGKNIDLIVGFTPGGGYDLMARLIAQHMGAHVPGRPRIIVRNMVGAGSRTATGWLANIAPRDGTALGTVSLGLALEQALGARQNYDMTKFLYVGNPAQENNSVVTWGTSGIASVDDAKTREVTMGSTGDDPSSHYPKVMNALLGTKFRIVYGYPGANEINLAMERGELDGRGSSTVIEWKSMHAEWLAQKKINLLAQVGVTKAPFLPDVPLLTDLAKNAEDRAIMELLAASLFVGRQLFTTPDVPQARLRALRAAFDATMRDPDFLAAARQQKFDIDPVTGEAMQASVRDMLATPPAILARLGAILTGTR